MEHLLANQHEVRKIALPTMQGLELVRIDQIVFVEADSNYTHFHLLSGNRILISKTLKQIEELLREHDCFIRTHQSFLVNTRLIDRYHQWIRRKPGYGKWGTSTRLSKSKRRSPLTLEKRIDLSSGSQFQAHSIFDQPVAY